METERIIRILFVIAICGIVLLAAYFFLSNGGSNDQEEQNEGAVEEMQEGVDDNIVAAGKIVMMDRPMALGPMSIEGSENMIWTEES